MSLESSACLLYVNKMIRIMTQTHQKTQDSNWLSDISVMYVKNTWIFIMFGWNVVVLRERCTVRTRNWCNCDCPPV